MFFGWNHTEGFMESKAVSHRLYAVKLPYTEIQSVQYECSDKYGHKSAPFYFYRVECKSSYEPGSLVYTQICLPENWNGKFTALGNGGMAGSIHALELLNYSRMGYVAAQTDMGTSGGRERGIRNPAVWRDFGWRSTHGMAVLGKALTEACYGRKPEYSYFIGSSTGGQQAFSLAQRFPADFDGIIAGVPANNRIALHTYFLWNHNHLRCKDGRALFGQEEISRIGDLAVQYFQNRGDGGKGDGFVSYPVRDDKTVAEFVDFLRESGFSEEQCQALCAVYSGPEDPASGKRIYNGMPIGSEIYSCGIKDCQNVESPYYYPFIWCFGADYNGYDFDFSKDYAILRETLSRDMDANSVDLSAFRACGGRMIVYSGSADPCVPYPDAEDYCNRLFAQNGGYGKTAEFFRYFLFPGRDHGCGGKGANREWAGTEGGSLLDLLRLWCEKSVAPESVTAARVVDGVTVFTRTLYPYGSERNPAVPTVNCCEIF